MDINEARRLANLPVDWGGETREEQIEKARISGFIEAWDSQQKTIDKQKMGGE